MATATTTPWPRASSNCSKRERIRRQIYTTRDDAKADVFNYIEMFYNPKRRHGTAGDTSPLEFERRIPNGLKVSRKAGAIHTAALAKTCGKGHHGLGGLERRVLTQCF